MTNRPDDELLVRARAAEEKLRRLLEVRLDPARVGIQPTQASSGSGDEVLTDQLLSLDDEFIMPITEPGGVVIWGLRIIPSSMEPAQLPDDGASIASSIIDEIARAVPQISLAIQQGRLFELIGPAQAIDGLQNGMLEMIPAKSGGLLGGIRIVGEKKIVHQARFRPAQLAGSIGPGLAMVAASAVLGHMHMVEIRRQLGRIENKIDRVLEGQQASRHGKLLGSMEVLRDVARSADMGTMRTLDLHRLAGAELDLRQIAAELEQLHIGYSERTSRLRASGLASFVESFSGTRRIEINDSRLYLAATAALMTVERLLVGYASFIAPESLPVRVSALQAATERLAAVGQRLAHLEFYHSHCRRALDDDQARAFRLSSADNERVSEELGLDRLTVAELLAAARRLSTVPGGEANVNVVRVDARGGTTRAQVVLLEVEK